MMDSMMEDSDGSSDGEGQFDNHSPLAKSGVRLAGTVAFSIHSVADIKASQSKEMVLLINNILGPRFWNPRLQSRACGNPSPPLQMEQRSADREVHGASTRSVGRGGSDARSSQTPKAAVGSAWLRV
jgi:hypothetical protein